VALTDTKIRSVKSREKLYKIADGRGLFLVIKPNGSKYWRFRYHFGAKEKLLAIGIYPDVSLADARRKRDEARKLLADDTDPGIAKQLKNVQRNLLPKIALNLSLASGISNLPPNGRQSMARKFSSVWKKTFSLGLATSLLSR
jgi:hypothetical protein